MKRQVTTLVGLAVFALGWGTKRLNATLGSGGCEVALQTLDGSIQLRRAPQYFVSMGELDLLQSKTSGTPAGKSKIREAQICGSEELTANNAASCMPAPNSSQSAIAHRKWGI